MASQCLNAKMIKCMNIENQIPVTDDWLESGIKKLVSYNPPSSLILFSCGFINKIPDNQKKITKSLVR